jgi:hypothetical protein
MTKKFLSRSGLLSQKIIAPQPCELPSGAAVLMRVPGAKDWRAYQASLRDKDGKYIDKRLERGDELLIATVLIDPETNERMFTVDDVMGGVFDDPHITAADINAMANRAYELFGKTDSPKFVTDEDREKNLSETAPNE